MRTPRVPAPNSNVSVPPPSAPEPNVQPSVTSPPIRLRFPLSRQSRPTASRVVTEQEHRQRLRQSLRRHRLAPTALGARTILLVLNFRRVWHLAKTRPVNVLLFCPMGPLARLVIRLYILRLRLTFRMPCLIAAQQGIPQEEAV